MAGLRESLNPLESGRCFLQWYDSYVTRRCSWSQSPRIGAVFPTRMRNRPMIEGVGLNPLESGRCFLHRPGDRDRRSPNRLNPLESGRCFLRKWCWKVRGRGLGLNPLESGRCFLQ